MATKKRTKVEFSKMLAIIITALFVASIVFSFAIWYRQNRVATELLAYVAAPFSIVISGYLAKAGIENYQKINQSQEYNEKTY